MPSSLMVVNGRGSAGQPTPQLLLNGTTLVPFGTPPATTFEPVFSFLSWAVQGRMAQIGDRVFWVQYDEILAYDKALDTWSVVHTLFQPPSQTIAGPFQGTAMGAMHYWDDKTTGEFGLAFIFAESSGNNVYMVKYVYSTNTWNSAGGYTGAPTAFSLFNSCMYRGLLVYQSGDSSVRTIDPTTLAVTAILVPTLAAGNYNLRFFVAKNKLFFLQCNSGQTALFVLGPSYFVKVAVLPNASVLSTWVTQGQHALIVDVDRVMVAYLHTANDRWNLAEIDLNTYVVTDRTADLPVELSGANATGTVETDWRVTHLVDQEQAFGTVRHFLIWSFGYQGQSSALYEYVAPGTAWSSLGNSEFNSFMGGYVNDTYGGSTRFFRPRETWGHVVQPLVSAAGGVIAKIRLFGNGDEPIQFLGDGTGAVFSLAVTPVGKFPIEPGTVVIDYTDVGTNPRQITDDGAGGLVGDVSGGATIDYATGVMAGTTSLAVESGLNKVLLSAYRTTKTVRIRYSSEEQTAGVQANMADPGLQGPIGGQAAIASNELRNVKVDNGATTYRVKLPLLAQGVPDGSRLLTFVEIEGP